MIARLVTVALLVATAVFQAQAADKVPAVPPDVEKAVLAEDWAKVAELIGEVKPETPSPQRLIHGHAYLALNRNNESLVLFLGAAAPGDMESWQTYAQDLRAANPNTAVADYFVGDGLARVGKYDEAMAAFDAGLAKSPTHVLLLNAKGVCLARAGRLAEAKEYFEVVARPENRLADAHANLGWHWIQRGEAAEAAIAHFDAALSHNQCFTLALLGRNEAGLVGGIATSTSDLDNCARKGEYFQTLVARDLVAYGLMRVGASASEAATELADLGTTFRRTYDVDTLVRSATNWGAVAETFRNDQRLPQFIREPIANFAGNRMVERFTAIHDNYGSQALNNAVKHNDITRRVGPQEIARVGSYNRDIRGAEKLVKDISGIGVIGASGLVLASPLPQVQVGAGVAGVGFKATEFAAKKAYDSSTMHNNTYKALDPSLLTGGSIDPRKSGGADLKIRAHWDDGNWPFKPLYGLAYGMPTAHADVPTKNATNPRLRD